MIRTANIADIDAIVAIYNQAIVSGFQTCFTRPLTVAERLPWFHQHADAVYPLFVYEVNGQVAGWLSVSAYRQGRAALRFAVEISYYIHTHYQRQGIGSLLLGHAIQQCRALGYKTLLAILLEANKGSIKLLQKCGFEQWGHLPRIADFGGVEVGQVYYGLKLP